MTETEDQDSLKALGEIYELYARTCGVTVSHEEAIRFIKLHLQEEEERKTYKNRWQRRIKELIANREKV